MCLAASGVEGVIVTTARARQSFFLTSEVAGYAEMILDGAWSDPIPSQVPQRASLT